MKMKNLLFSTVVLSSLMAIETNAQLTLTGSSYEQNFNNLATAMPIGWTVDTGATATFLGHDVSATYFINVPHVTNTTWANTSGRFKNFASGTGYTYFGGVTGAIQETDTNRALGVRQTSGTDKGTAFVLTLANTAGLANFDLSFKLQSLDSTSTRITTWTIDYGFGTNPTTFTPATAVGTLTTGGNTFTNNTITVDFGTALNNQSGPVVIRIVNLAATTGSNNRASTGIDDVMLTWSGVGAATNIQVVDKSPMGSNVPLSTNELMVKFDNPIAKGTGNIQLFEVGNSTPIDFDITSAAVSVSDSTATISGVALNNNTSYYVNMPAGAFTKTGGTLPSLAIDDTITWTFSTVDTVTPPPPTPLTSLNETFSGCTSAAMGVFVQHSTIGDKKWNCSIFARTDSSAVYINGGSSSGAQANSDWLISSAPFDFSASGNQSVVLSFWQKRRFDGNVTRKLVYSTDYIAGTDPASANWTELAASQMAQKPEGTNVWSQVSGISLSNIKSTPFYLAFTYACGTDSAYELTYDDIVVDFVNSAFKPLNNQIDVKVLGAASSNLINLGINFKKNTQATIAIYDMAGRRVYNTQLSVTEGNYNYAITNANLNAGMYVIRVTDGTLSGVVKAMIQ